MKFNLLANIQAGLLPHYYYDYYYFYSSTQTMNGTFQKQRKIQCLPQEACILMVQ